MESKTHNQIIATGSQSMGQDAEDDEHEAGAKLFKAPDGGYGWMVVFAAFVVQFLLGGLLRVISVLYTQFLSHFNQSAAATSAVLSIFGIIKILSAPLASMLCNTYSHRLVTMIGGVVMTTGLVITAYAPSLPLVYFSYSVITGFGCDLILTANSSIIPLYFDKKRGRAAAIAFMGADLGAVAIAALTQFLFTEFNYTGGLFILAGVFLNVCVAGALYRPLRIPQKSQKLRNANIKDVCYEMRSQVVDSVGRSDDTCTLKTKISNLSEGKTNQIDGDHKQNTGEENGSLIAGDSTSNTKKGLGCQARCGHWIYSKFDLALLKHVGFVWFCLHMMCYFIAYQATLTVISELAIEKGLTKHQVSYLLMIGNAIITPLKLITVSIFDVPVIRKYDELIMAVGGVFMGISVVVLPLATSFLSLAILYTVHLYIVLGIYGNFVNALRTMLGAARITSAVGLVRPICGVGELLGNTLTGAIKDALGNFSWSLWVIGSFYLVVVCIYLTRVIYCIFYRPLSCKSADIKGKPENI